MMGLENRLRWPGVHEADDHAFQFGEFRRIIQISTHGFAGYPEAVDLAFGPHARFGTIIKDYRKAIIISTPSEMVGASHVEHHNLTVRTFIRRFTRLSLGFSKKLENLEAAIALFLCYYNFCSRPGKTRITPAMAAGVTEKLWSFADLINELDAS